MPNNISTTSLLTQIRDWVLSKIAEITALIPAQASTQNQLADKAFVNSSIATATATPRGTYNLVSDLSLTTEATRVQIAAALATKMAALSITPDKNDYCFVQIPTDDATPTEIERVDRYKYDGSAWGFEYSLNNSGYTAEQWAAINSGITAGAVTKLADLPTAAALTALFDGKQNVIQDLAAIRSGASAGATAVQPAAMSAALVATVAESGVYDVTANNDNAKFASLSALLNDEDLATLIPVAKRKGGMSIKFVCTSDNKYVQYRLMSDSFNTTVANWQGVETTPTRNSKNFVDSNGIFQGDLDNTSLIGSAGSINESELTNAKEILPDGTIGSYTFSKANTKFLKCIEGEFIAFKLDARNSALVIAFYSDADENAFIANSCVSGQNIGTYVINTVQVPSGAKYFRYTCASLAQSYIYYGLHSDIHNIFNRDGYFLCQATTASVSDRVLDIAPFKLEVGGSIKVKFNVILTASSATLKIGDTEAKTLYYNGSPASNSNSWATGEVVQVFYDGSVYQAWSIENKITDNTHEGGKDIKIGNVIVKAINAGYKFMGIATPDTSVPATIDSKIFYIGSNGVYSNFGSTVTVPCGCLVFFLYNGGWNSVVISFLAYTTNTQSETTTNKTIVLNGFSLVDGITLRVKFANKNIAINAKLNVNSTGAKSILYDGKPTDAYNTWVAGEIVEFVYDSNNDVWNGHSTSYEDAPTRLSSKNITSDAVYRAVKNGFGLYRNAEWNEVPLYGIANDLIYASNKISVRAGAVAYYYKVQSGDKIKITCNASASNGGLAAVFFATARTTNTDATKIKGFEAGEHTYDYNVTSDGYIFVQAKWDNTYTISDILVKIEENTGNLIDFSSIIGNLNELNYILDNDSVVAGINSLVDVISPILATEYSPINANGNMNVYSQASSPTLLSPSGTNVATANYYRVLAGERIKVRCTGSGSNNPLYMIYFAQSKTIGAAATRIFGFSTSEKEAEITPHVDGYIFVQTEFINQYGSYTTSGIVVAKQRYSSSVVDLFPQINTAPKIVNRMPNFDKEEFRVLLIGNSFDGDYTARLQSMCDAAGLDTSKICIYFLMRAGGTFKMWYDIYNDQADSTYGIYKRLGALSTQSQDCIYAVDANGDSIDDRVGVAVQGTDGSFFREVLANNKWDIVSIHQDTALATSYDWEGHDEQGYLNELVRIVRTNCPNTCIGTIIQHAGYTNAVERLQTTEERFMLIANANKMFQRDYGIDMIVPCGTAVENIRKSVINTSSQQLCYDGHHLGHGVAQIAATSALYESIIAPRYGISVLGNPYRFDASSYANDNEISVTDDNAYTVQMAAILAINDMYKVQNPDGVIL